MAKRDSPQRKMMDVVRLLEVVQCVLLGQAFHFSGFFY
jgi:hypothetical protein